MKFTDTDRVIAAIDHVGRDGARFEEIAISALVRYCASLEGSIYTLNKKLNALGSAFVVSSAIIFGCAGLISKPVPLALHVFLPLWVSFFFLFVSFVYQRLGSRLKTISIAPLLDLVDPRNESGKYDVRCLQRRILAQMVRDARDLEEYQCNLSGSTRTAMDASCIAYCGIAATILYLGLRLLFSGSAIG